MSNKIYRVTYGDGPAYTGDSVQTGIDYDMDPSHHGWRDFQEASELAIHWLQKGHGFVRIFEGASEVITVEHNVITAHTVAGNLYVEEHKAIVNALIDALSILK